MVAKSLPKKEVRPNHTPVFTHVTAAEARDLLPGTILFLPPKEKLPDGAYADANLHHDAFNHPVVITSCPSPSAINHSSHIEISLITSFHNSPIKKHLAQKGIIYKTSVLASQKAGFLRLVTASKPHAKDCLRFRNGKGMKREIAYVNVKETFGVEVKALARYGGRGEEVGAYRLTAHSLKTLLETVLDHRKRRKMKVERAELAIAGPIVETGSGKNDHPIEKAGLAIAGPIVGKGGGKNGHQMKRGARKLC